ncbi:MAG: hypothetical protein ACRD0D_04100, partial [Acidimicrobiales bacterium]
MRDLLEGRVSIPALLVSVGAPRLRTLGFNVASPAEDPDHALPSEHLADVGHPCHTRSMHARGPASPA